jgi:hypothetical protein
MSAYVTPATSGNAAVLVQVTDVVVAVHGNCGGL